MISLKLDCGASEGQDASSALLRAFDKVNAGRDHTVLIDGSFLVSNTVNYNFLNRVSTLQFVGLGSRSRLVPHLRDDKVALILHNLDSLSFQDFVFAGYPKDLNDASSVISLNHIQQVSFNRTHFYGIACTKGGVIIGLSYCDVAFRDCLWWGCCISSGSQLGAVHNSKWLGFRMERCQFRDYGVLDSSDEATYKKTPISASYSWVALGDVSDHPTNAWAPLWATIEDCRFDEGALHAVVCVPNPSTSAPIRGVRIRNIGVNGFNRQSGIYARHVTDLVVEDSFFGWATHAGTTALETVDVLRPRMTRCVGGQAVNRISASGNMEQFILEDSPTFTVLDIPTDKLRVIRNGQVV